MMRTNSSWKKNLHHLQLILAVLRSYHTTTSSFCCLAWNPQSRLLLSASSRHRHRHHGIYPAFVYSSSSRRNRYSSYISTEWMSTSAASPLRSAWALSFRAMVRPNRCFLLQVPAHFGWTTASTSLVSPRMPRRRSSFEAIFFMSSESDSVGDEKKVLNDPDQSYSTAQRQRYLATCIPGLATVLERELVQLGATNVFPSGNAAVQFEATLHTALRILLWVRTAHKLMEFLVSTEDEVGGGGREEGEGGHDNHRNVISTPDDLYNFVQRNVCVKTLLGDGQGGLLTLSVSVQYNNPNYIPADLNHSHFTALTIKNALVDKVRDLRNDRPNIDLITPQVPLVAILRGIPPPSLRHPHDNRSTSSSHNSLTPVTGVRVSLYRCLHPPISLHKRGYRSGQPIHKAALKESLAAGLLLYAGWDNVCRSFLDHHTTTQPTRKMNSDATTLEASSTTGSMEPLLLVDPMAGSGSIVIEAAMMAVDLAPGLVRIKCHVPGFLNPPILQWKYPPEALSHTDVSDTGANDDHDSQQRTVQDIWKELLREATQSAQKGIRKMKDNSSWLQIHANDVHSGALDLMQQSLQSVGLVHVVQVHCQDCQDLNLVPTNDSATILVVTNPPWGVRLEDNHLMSWDSLRIFLRDNCPQGGGATEAWVLSGNKDVTQNLALRKTRSVSLHTGEHDLRWIQYHIRTPNPATMFADTSGVTSQTPFKDDSIKNYDENNGRSDPFSDHAPPRPHRSVIRSEGRMNGKKFQAIQQRPKPKRLLQKSTDKSIPNKRRQEKRESNDTWFID